MDNKYQEYYKSNKLRIEQLIKNIVKIDQVDTIDFREYAIMMNKIENSSFLMKKKGLTAIALVLKKIFQVIDKDKYLFYEYKYNLLDCLTEMMKFLQKSEKNEELENNNINLNKHISYFENELVKQNKNNRYYYIKLNLNRKEELFFLTRSIFLEFLKQYGKPYNFTPRDLNNDKYDYFMFDFELDKNIENFEIMLKEYKDSAIRNIEILNMGQYKSVYNVKFYYKDNKDELPEEVENSFHIIDSECYYNMVDTYILEDDEVRISEILFNKNFDGLEIVTLKKFSENETRILVLLDLKRENLEKVKDRLRDINFSKDVQDIIFKGKYDFFGLQLLEYLKEKYNIEYGGY